MGEGYGSAALTGEQTLSQCLAAALQMAKTDAKGAGCETFSSQQIEICSDIADIVNCESPTNFEPLRWCLHRRNSKKNLDNTKSECIASLEADVRFYKSKHDPDFGLEALFEEVKINEMRGS